MEINLTDSTFDATVASAPVMIVDFWAPWCGPCRALGPTIAQIAAEREGKLTVGKCNVDECEESAIKFGIRSVPTIMFFKNGEKVNTLVGNQPKAKIDEVIDSLL